MMYQFRDGSFSFWTALYGSWANDKKIVFRVRNDRKPMARAKEKVIEHYDRIVPSTKEEIDMWLASHPDSPLEGSENSCMSCRQGPWCAASAIDHFPKHHPDDPPPDPRKCHWWEEVDDVPQATGTEGTPSR